MTLHEKFFKEMLTKIFHCGINLTKPMRKSEYVLLVFPKRAAGGGIAVLGVNQNGLPRASRKENVYTNFQFSKYVRRSMTLRKQKSAYVSMRKWVYFYTKPGGTAG